VYFPKVVKYQFSSYELYVEVNNTYDSESITMLKNLPEDHKKVLADNGYSKIGSIRKTFRAKQSVREIRRVVERQFLLDKKIITSTAKIIRIISFSNEPQSQSQLSHKRSRLPS
jgi:hypothetical protein